LLDLLAQRLDIGIHPRQPADESLVKQLVHARAERDRLLRRVQGQAHENRAEASSTSSPPSDDDQTFVEAQQRIAELERTITDDWHKLLVRNADYARDAALWQVQVSSPQPHLAVGQVLVEYFALQDDLLLFCITPHHITTHRAPHGMAQAQTLLRNLWLNTNAVVHSPPQHLDALTRNAQAILEQLHALLLQPIAEHIPPATQLIIVPHGPLHYLPFHALTDGAHYLIEQHEVSYLPASSALAHLAQPVVAQGPLRCTAFGHTRGGLLPLAVDETRSVAAQMGGRSFVEAEATLAQLRAAAANSDVLHLAMHGNFRADNALFSGLQLDDGTLTTLDIFGLKLRAALVTLSACQTGRNVVSGGDELLGLARAFFSAGAATLLLSLWRVEDVATTELMQTFYAQLRAGATKAAALRAAQRALLSQQRHPFFWAPFFLMGDGGQLPAASH
jgi:CHAT domain-containing protein